MAKPKRFFIVVAFLELERRWRPVWRCETLRRAREVCLDAYDGMPVFTDIWSSIGDIDDVEAVEALCAELPPVKLFEVFSAHADLADQAFLLGGGKWFRVPPDAVDGEKPAKPRKGGTIH